MVMSIVVAIASHRINLSGLSMRKNNLLSEKYRVLKNQYPVTLC